VLRSPTSIPTALRAGRALLRGWAERRAFERVDKALCDSRQLARITSDSIAEAFLSPEIDEDWHAVERKVAAFDITEHAGGVNPGDRRAIYYLVRYFRPRTVLEIGTHVGASTVHVAAALQKAQEEDPGSTYRMTTVDITNVNDRIRTPWLRFGSTHSPAEMAERLGFESGVSFVTARSLDYFASCDDRYDFIFLDGDHAPATVYREVPAALRVLRSGGVVLLHDYFPDLQPLWSNRAVLEGPWLATERLRAEGTKLEVVPLGELPWPTKLGSRTTSLALLVGG
jgi:predicted O-methyltransferase YrrM